MEYRILGKTGEKVSLLSYGTGGPSQFGQKTGGTDKSRKRLITLPPNDWSLSHGITSNCPLAF